MRQGRRGQALLEYLLLLTVTIGMAAIIMRTLVRKDPEDPGALLRKWNEVIKQIGEDDPNETEQQGGRR